jgi:hypothetical protein
MKSVKENNKIAPDNVTKTAKNTVVPRIAKGNMIIPNVEGDLYQINQPPICQRLNTLTNSRKSLARLMRMYKNGQVADQMFRSMIGGYNVLLQYFKAIAELEIEARLTKIEALLTKGAKL